MTEVPPGVAVPATPEDAEALRQLFAEVERDPEKYRDHAWGESGGAG